MRTRLLESKELFRNTVKSMNFVKMDGNSLYFESEIPPQSYRNNMFVSWDPSEMINELNKRTTPKGALRIDLITDKILRVRYNEGEKVKKNNTPMVVGTFKGPSEVNLEKKKVS